MDNMEKFVNRFGKGIKGFGVGLGIVCVVLLTVSIVKQCKSGAEVQTPVFTTSESK